MGKNNLKTVAVLSIFVTSSLLTACSGGLEALTGPSNQDKEGTINPPTQKQTMTVAIQQNRACLYGNGASGQAGVYTKTAQKQTAFLASDQLFYVLKVKKTNEIVECGEFEVDESKRIKSVEQSLFTLTFDKIENFDPSQYKVDLVQNSCTGTIVASTASLSNNRTRPGLEGVFGVAADAGHFVMTNRLYTSNVKPATADECNTDDPPPPADCECDETQEPLVLDMDGNGLQLVGAASGVMFDAENSGTKIRIGWTQGSSKDALVARDLNGNGKIDGGHELFGDATETPDGLLAANGFEALNAFDRNDDQVIDDRDSIYSSLLLWVDANHDGVSQAAELQALSKKVAAIQLKYNVVNKTLNNNKIYAESTATLKTALANGKKEIYAADVWFEAVK